MIEGYRISKNKNEMNIDSIHSYLTASYWAVGIPKKTMQIAIDNSFCFGVFKQNDQVGFARLVTDYATFAYLADVYILEEHRGKGLSKWLLTEIINHPQLQGLRRIVLATRDAHSLYEQFGFKELDSPEIFMELWSQNVYVEA
jgi:N-acetylglutamate synthase-like GNAT family acetyltransferase